MNRYPYLPVSAMGPVPPSPLPVLLKQIVTGDGVFLGDGWGHGLCTFVAIYSGYMVHTPQHRDWFYLGGEQRGSDCGWISLWIQAESRLRSTSCAYEPSHKSELMLHLSKGDHCLTHHPFPALATCTFHLFAVISACGRRESDGRLSHMVWPSVQGPQSPRHMALPQSTCRDWQLCPLSLCYDHSLARWRGLCAGMQYKSSSLSNVQQTGPLPSLPMKHLLQRGQCYLSRRCLDELELNANKIIPKAVRGYCHTIML